MLKDWCTWDKDYNLLVQDIRNELIKVANVSPVEYTSVLMQGSGTFSVESVIGSMIPQNGKLLVVSNGAYGNRMAQIANYLHIENRVVDFGELSLPDLDTLENILITDKDITHVAMVHCETTTGMLNPVNEVGKLTKAHKKIYFVDAMSSFGGIPIDFAEAHIDFLVSSANKCIQGVPGFGFIIARTEELIKCDGQARSLSLDLFDQWYAMEKGNGKWRYTSPTHTVRAFRQALIELDEEGGVEKRFERYTQNHRVLVEGMQKLGFETLLAPSQQSPIITSFLSPQTPNYRFGSFYNAIKEKGFVIYPGKVTDIDSFRIGNIGHIFSENIRQLVAAIAQSIKELNIELPQNT
jgi:2-aminoethylphosphonate-pyruvate transaminase